MSNNITRITADKRDIILLGTAHVSKESVQEVRKVIETEKPDRVCIEIDESRKEIIALSEAKKDFIADITHDIKTPLSVISGHSELLKEDFEATTNEWKFINITF